MLIPGTVLRPSPPWPTAAGTHSGWVNGERIKEEEGVVQRVRTSKVATFGGHRVVGRGVGRATLQPLSCSMSNTL